MKKNCSYAIFVRNAAIKYGHWCISQIWTPLLFVSSREDHHLPNTRIFGPRIIGILLVVYARPACRQSFALYASRAGPVGIRDPRMESFVLGFPRHSVPVLQRSAHMRDGLFYAIPIRKKSRKIPEEMEISWFGGGLLVHRIVLVFHYPSRAEKLLPNGLQGGPESQEMFSHGKPSDLEDRIHRRPTLDRELPGQHICNRTLRLCILKIRVQRVDEQMMCDKEGETRSAIPAALGGNGNWS